MILMDWSQLYIAGCLAFPSDFQKGADTKKMEGVARHVVLSSVKAYNEQYKKKFGEIVICVDGKNLWRRAYFSEYKAHRAKGREESDIDWKSIMDIGADLREALIENFPYRVLNVEGAEGDDIIGVLVKHSQDNWLNQDGLMESPQDMLVISSDHDYRQLSKYKNYHQWSPIQKKVVPRANKTFLLEKILHGDKGDGIPNVKCANDFLVSKPGRAPSITKKFVDKFLANPDGSTLTEQEKIYFDRNKKLIDFDCIPQAVYNNIIHEYENFEIKGSQNKVMNYFIKNRCKNLMQEIPAFF